MSASSPREHQPQPAVWTPAPSELLLSGIEEELEEEGGRRRRDCCRGRGGGAGRRSDWLRRRPLLAPRAPSHAPSRLPPSAPELVPAGGGTRRGGTRLTRPGAREDKTLGGVRGPRVRQPPERGEAGPVPLAARASAPRTRLPERGAQRAGARRPERRGCTCSPAMKRVQENPLELAETFPAPGVAAAAAAA